MMSFKEFKAVSMAKKVAGPQEERKSKNSVLPSTSLTPSPSPSTQSATHEELHVKMCKMFAFIDDTYRDLRRFNSGLHKDSISIQLMQTINKYKNGCNEIYTKVLESYDMCLKLAQNIVRTIDIFKELCTQCLSDVEEYNYRLCEIMSIFVVCELRLSVDAPQEEQLLIAHRIIYLMRRHLVQEEQHETLNNILRTLVYIPKFFNARDIMCAIFGEFIPIKPVLEVNVLPDKLYMLYIIVFYRWMMMQKDDNGKQLIVNFAESFMKPAVSLCSNSLYAAYLPMYTTHSSATRTILNNLKYYRDIRNASIIDNALKKIGAVVNLCDDEEDDIIVLDSAPITDFAQIFASVRLEPLSGSISNIKLEDKTVVSTIDLTEEEEEDVNVNPITSINDRHNEWLNEFHRSAKLYRESQLLLQKQQNNQMIPNGEKRAVICLDSDSEDEEEISAAASEDKPATAATATASTTTTSQRNNSEDLFVDNYPLTNTPINCDSDLESLEAEDENDVTKISPRFLSGALRTYQAKKSILSETGNQNTSDANKNNHKSQDMNKAYRRDSIHISSSPPVRTHNEDDEGTDVQDEHDDLIDEEEESVAYSFLPSPIKRTEKKIIPKEIRPMGPYPTYNNMHNDKVVFSQALSSNSEHQQQQQQQRHHQDKQYYYSDSSEKKTPKKQKKRVQFNTSPLGPTASGATQKTSLKPTLHQPNYKASEELEYFHLRGFERFSVAPSIAGSTSTSASNSTSSSIKQQEHLAAAATLFRNVFGSVRQSQPYPGPFSPSSSSVSSRSLTSPAIPSTTRKKSRLPKNKKDAIKLRRATMGTRDDFLNRSESPTNNEECYSIIRSREILNDGYNSTGMVGLTSYEKRSDDYYGVASDSDMIVKDRYKNDAKLRKRCAVVITPTKELIQYERKRDEMYNEILQKQRRKLELRALEKQREKERRRLGRREEKREQTKLNNIDSTAAATASDKINTNSRRTRNYNEIFMSSESEYETNFQVRTRHHRQEKFQELEPLNIQIEMTEATTTTLLSQIDAHLDKPATEKTNQFEEKPQDAQQTCKNYNKQQICDISSDRSPTKMRELNLLADIAQHLSPYQLDLPENNNPPRSLSPASEKPSQSAPQTPRHEREVPKEKVTVTEHLIIQSLDNLLEKTKSQLNNNYQHHPQQQQQEKEEEASNSCALEPKLNIAAIFQSSPCANLLQNQNQQNNTQLENNDNTLPNNSTSKEFDSKIQTDETLEQILEESMSVLKSVTSPFNPRIECTSIQPQTHSNSTIPLLISNVESLNHIIEQNDAVAKQNSVDKVHLLFQDATKNNSENVVTEKELLSKEANNITKQDAEDVEEQHGNLNRNEESTDLPSTIVDKAENAIMCVADLANIPNETEISQTLTVPSLLAAELSDISLESEISKNLPEIAEPSPVVTDMSDNSNESEVSKSFGLHIPIVNNSTANTSGVAEMSLPDLSLEMPNIVQPPTLSTSQEEPIESNFNNFNCTLNTPIKLVVGTSREEQCVNNPTNDLNTPLKFAIQPEIESNNMPPKNNLEPEADNNVTKFLDLILNKTVTDAESETRDKIIKELDALTADPTAADLPMGENNSNCAIMPLESNGNEDVINKTTETVKSVEENEKLEEKTSDESGNVIKEQTNLTTGSYKSLQTLENSSNSHIIENNLSTAETVELVTSLKAQNTLKVPSANKELINLNPPIERSREEYGTELLSDIPTTESSDNVSAISLSPFTKFKSPAIKKAFNIKCRVRLKRLNINAQCKTTKNEALMDVTIEKPEEPICSNNYISICDTATETTATNKKPCLKRNNQNASEELQDKVSENLTLVTETGDVMPSKKPKLEIEQATKIETTQTLTTHQPPIQALTQSSQASAAIVINTTSTSKSKTKPLKTVTFDLSNLNDELRDNTASNHRQKTSKSQAAGIAAGALGWFLKNSRPHKKLPDNTLRAAETLQLFVNTINDSSRTPPPPEFNKKRSPIKNKCIAEDETPRPPPASTLMGTTPCKKSTEKSRSQIIPSKCKDQLVSSLSTPSISSINDITTARIYTSSPLDQTLPEYDDNVDTVADSELILPTTTGSLRRKLKRPKKTMTRPEPTDDISTDDISNQPECNGEDDTDVAVDNEDDVFAEELLPIPAANEHILEKIVSGRPSHIGAGTVIRDDYMNIEATATVPVYLFNDESSDLATPDPIQSSDTTNVVDSSSYLNSTPSVATNNIVAGTHAASTSLAMGNLEKSMLSPSEHEVSSTQETFYQTPTKNKQTEIFADKSSTSKDKGNSTSGLMTNNISKQKADDSKFQNKEDYQTSSANGLLQNNQVDTTNHSPEMCTLSLTATTTTPATMTSSRKIRKASTHDEILFNELQQQQLPSNKRKSTTKFCVESTSDNNSNTTITSKIKIVKKNLDDVKSNGALVKVEDKFKKLLKEVCKRDKSHTANGNELDVGATAPNNNGVEGGGSSPSTTTTIIEEKLSKSKRKKQKSSKSSKNKSHSERSSKIVLKASKLTPQIPANPLIITIPKSRLLRPPTTPIPSTPTESQDDQQQSVFLDTPSAKLFIEKDKETTTAVSAAAQHNNQYTHQHIDAAQSIAGAKNSISDATAVVSNKAMLSQSPVKTQTEIVNTKPNKIFGFEMNEVINNTNSTITPKEKSYSSSDVATKKKDKHKTSNNNTNTSSTICTNNINSNNNVVFVKDKYDLIKSKDKVKEKHHHHHEQADLKEKSKVKASSHTKTVTIMNTRLHKSSTKEKTKGEKAKEKSKGTKGEKSEKLVTQQQPDNVSKLQTSQSSNKSISSSSFAIKLPCSSSNAKQSSSKSNRSNSFSSNASLTSSSSTSAIPKSKTNLSTTQSSATAAVTAATSQTPTATLSTNNVRKKLKIK